jgi:hypothetical protein
MACSMSSLKLQDATQPRSRSNRRLMRTLQTLVTSRAATQHAGGHAYPLCLSVYLDRPRMASQNTRLDSVSTCPYHFIYSSVSREALTVGHGPTPPERGIISLH